MHRYTLLIALPLVLVSALARAQVAADETLRLAETIPSPWGAPLGPAMPNGTKLRLAAGVMDGPSPLECPGATHSFVQTPAAGLFEGNLPAPAEQSAKSLGMPDHIVTQRVVCANGGFDVHRAADGRAWIGLDNAVLRWERVSVAKSPEATVQLLLVEHFASNMAFSRERVAAQSASLSQTLFDSMERWFARTAGSDEAPYLNGDPYTDSQEPPNSFQLAPAALRGDRAELVVMFGGASIAAYPVRFELLRVKGAWRIDDLRYRDGQRLSQALLR